MEFGEGADPSLTYHPICHKPLGAVCVAGDLVLKGKRNRFSNNEAGHHDADIYVDEALGGRVLREKSHGEL